MARINDSGQWIVLMAILVSIGLFFLAFILNQSTIVGQTTSEGVLEFSKNDIQDLRGELIELGHWIVNSGMPYDDCKKDIISLAQYRKNAIISFDIDTRPRTQNDCISGSWKYDLPIHFNNGVTEYNEIYKLFIGNC